jgi:hypothetical protein
VDLAQEAFVPDHQHGRPVGHVIGRVPAEFVHLGLRLPARETRELAGEHHHVVPE